MPWTVDDVEKHVKGLSNKEKRRWVAVANSTLEKCLQEDESKECEAMAIKVANGIVNNHAISYYREGAGDYKIRQEQHQGRNHLVVPVVMMTEGVHAGSHGPLLHLGEDLAKFPAAWNGIPVAIQHPQEDGKHVSANDPSVIDEQVVGRVFNTYFEDGKLRAEAWLDEESLKKISPLTLGYLRQGKPLDVSLGIFTDEEMIVGDFKGERYEGIARNHRPDHLALLPGGKGACSWSDGCGVRANEEFIGSEKPLESIDSEDFITTLSLVRFSGTESGEWGPLNFSDFGVEGKWSNLSFAEKSRIASHYLAGSPSASSFEELKLPVVNPKTGKLNERALRAVISGRGAATGGNVSVAQRASARQKAYRLLNSEFDAELKVPPLSALEDLDRGLYEMFGPVLNELSYGDVSSKIQQKLNRMDDDVKSHYLMEVFSDRFIYKVCVREKGYEDSLTSPTDEQMFVRAYKLGKDDSLEFLDEARPVVKKITYVTQEGERTMLDAKPCCPEKVELLIQSPLTKFEESDREWLMALSEEQVSKLTPTEPPIHEEDRIEMTEDEAFDLLKGHFNDPEKFMSLLAQETREQMQFGMKLYKDYRNDLIGHIKSGTDVYSDADLTSMSNGELEKLSKVVKPQVNYVPMGSEISAPVVHSAGEMLLPPGVK